ncbi:MAG: flagellar type III secretion system protein FliQ [Sedimentisphaerales bacterium]|nr:flagellar type III secretion system protein FliQ [Sedimentisphaerales bacterium]
MNPTQILYLGRYTLETALLLAAPVLLACMISGIAISLFQTMTSLRDMTLTMVPKLVAVGVVLLVFGNWMMQILMRFTNDIFAQIQAYGH